MSKLSGIRSFFVGLRMMMLMMMALSIYLRHKIYDEVRNYLNRKMQIGQQKKYC